MAVKKAVKKAIKPSPSAKAASGKTSAGKAKSVAAKPPASKKPVSKAALKKAPAKAPAKAATPKKAAAAKAPAKKAPAKRAAAAKPTAAKPASAKKPVTRPSAAKVPTKAAPKKPAPKKPVAKVMPAKPPAKTAAKAAKPAPAAVSKKPVASRSTANKAPAKAAATSEGRRALPAAHKPAPERKLPRNVAVADVTGSAKRNPVKPLKVKVVSYKTDESGHPILPKGYKPDAQEEYMSALQLEYFRQRLLTWRADLVDESKQTIENLKEEVRDIGDEAERATRETENSLELRTRDRYRKLIGKIDEALKRVEDGSFGWCVDTGEEIGLDRLDARLTAERTIDAQERWEHRQKQMGD